MAILFVSKYFLRKRLNKSVFHMNFLTKCLFFNVMFILNHRRQFPFLKAIHIARCHKRFETLVVQQLVLVSKIVLYIFYLFFSFLQSFSSSSINNNKLFLSFLIFKELLAPTLLSRTPSIK